MDINLYSTVCCTCINLEHIVLVIDFMFPINGCSDIVVNIFLTIFPFYSCCFLLFNLSTIF
jgi:hypothetical protein